MLPYVPKKSACSHMYQRKMTVRAQIFGVGQYRPCRRVMNARTGTRRLSIYRSVVDNRLGWALPLAAQACGWDVHSGKLVECCLRQIEPTRGNVFFKVCNRRGPRNGQDCL